MNNKKTHIKNTTLFSVCWGKEYFENTLKSILCSIENIEFEKIIIATNHEDIDKYQSILNNHNIEIVNTYTELNSNLKNDDTNREQFSNFFLNTLNKYCHTDFILTIQQDSAVINPELWTDDFFNYDYIGAPWPLQIIQSSDMVAGKIKDIKNTVGNGGFSLRSKKYTETSLKMPTCHKNEDLNLCIFNYEQMVKNGIKFAPQDLAIKFSVEHPIKDLNVFDRNFLMTYNSFGFHGDFNVAGMKFISNNNRYIS